MKSYEEIDHQQDHRDNVVSYMMALIFIASLLVGFIFHLLIRHNALAEKYSGCMETVKLYSNAWEQTR